MRHKHLFILALGVAAVLAACGGQAKIDPLEIGDPERGREIHETSAGLFTLGIPGVGCSGCHSLDANVLPPAGTDKGPTFQGIAERAAERVPGMSAEEYLRQSIVDPSAYVVEGFPDYMPKGFRFLIPEEDIENLIAFLLTQ